MEVADCTIQNNNSNGLYGSNSNLEVSGNTIQSNRYDGIRAENASAPTITNNIICQNKNNGIYTQDVEHAVMKNNWIYRNGDGSSDCGLYLKDSISPPFIRNNTIVKNYGYGIYIPSGFDPCLVNSIIWKNGSSADKNIYSVIGLEDIEASYNCIEGGFPGTGNISCDPCFRNPDANDFHLKPVSLCIDVGDPCAGYEDETDIDGQCRVIFGALEERADIGADEFAPKADYTGDSIVNFIDFARLALAWKSTNSPAITLDDDNDVDIYDLARFCEDWLWIAPCSPVYEMLAGRSESDSGMADATDESAELVYETPVAMAVEEPATGAEVMAEEPTESIAQPLGDEQIEELLDWLEEIWQTDPGLRDMIAPNDYQSFIDSLSEQLSCPDYEL